MVEGTVLRNRTLSNGTSLIKKKPGRKSTFLLLIFHFLPFGGEMKKGRRLKP